MKSQKLILIEEIFNSIVHGIGFIAVIVGLVLFFVLHQKIMLSQVVGISVFGVSLLILYSMSTLFHGLTYTRAKGVFKILDHAAVYILIAGSYTPLLIALHSTFGWVMLTLIWIIAILGVVYKSIVTSDEKLLSTLSYLIMGWLVVFTIHPLLHIIHTPTLILLILGGVSYTVGTIFFALKKIPFNHVIWHIFVILGSTFHFLAVSML